jgi:hypothetical protein
MSDLDRWITTGTAHRCGCGETYTDSDGGCSTTWECAGCQDEINCEGEQPSGRQDRCVECEKEN